MSAKWDGGRGGDAMAIFCCRLSLDAVADDGEGWLFTGVDDGESAGLDEGSAWESEWKVREGYDGEH